MSKKSKSRSSQTTHTTDSRTTGSVNLGAGGDLEDSNVSVVSGNRGTINLTDAGTVEQSFEFATEALGAANNLAELSLGSLAAVKSGNFKPKTESVPTITDGAVKVIAVGAGAYVLGKAIKNRGKK